MYVRPSHRPRTDDDILRILREPMFATLVTSSPAGMVATHLPFVFENGILYAHMARANQQSETIDAAELHVPEPLADRLINEVLLGSLLRRPTPNVDVWLAAALTTAVAQETSQ
jgi:hypothetical protein